MPSLKNGSLRLFRFAGIDVFLHWAWFLVAAFEISNRTRNYSSPVWNVLEYLTLFLIVMVHEFGHALACRQVGGIADRIMLWPLGGGWGRRDLIVRFGKNCRSTLARTGMSEPHSLWHQTLSSAFRGTRHSTRSRRG